MSKRRSSDAQPFRYRGSIIAPAWVGYHWHHPPTHGADCDGETGGGTRELIYTRFIPQVQPITIAQCQEDVDEYIDELEADAAIAPESDVAQIQREAFDGEAD